MHIKFSVLGPGRVLAIGLVVAFCGSKALGQAAEARDSTWQVKVDFQSPIKTLHPAYASVNVNNPVRLLEESPAYDEEIKALNFQMMRFQGPGHAWDYSQIYTDEDFRPLDDSVRKALEVWGVQDLMFGFHRIRLPKDDDGKYLKEEYPAYAAFCAQLVRRYPQVRYWEPFNELDHPRKLEAMSKAGQSYSDIVELYIECAKAMKAANPQIKIGGPSLVDANPGRLDTLLKEAREYVDFVSWHDYSTGNVDSPDDKVLSAIVGPARFVGGANRLHNVMKRHNLAHLPMFLDEYHVNYRAGYPREVRTATQFSAVFTASVLSNMSRSQAQRLFIHELRTRHYGLIGPVREERFADQSGMLDKSSVDAIRARPVAWVFKWFNRYAGGQWVHCETVISEEDAQSPRGGLLEACAWRTDEAKVLLLVNKDTEPRTVEVDMGVIHSDGFSLPVRTMMIADGVPTESLTAGTRDGRLTIGLPAMSVMFVVREL